jgi:very-short-patch-repair endonuclease
MSNQTFLHLLATMKLPEPRPEFQFNSKRKWRFDYAWPSQKLALEVEGGVFTQGRHTRPVGFLKDMEKYNCAAMMGWRILRTTPDKLIKQETIELIKQSIN